MKSYSVWLASHVFWRPLFPFSPRRSQAMTSAVPGLTHSVTPKWWFSVILSPTEAGEHASPQLHGGLQASRSCRLGGFQQAAGCRLTWSPWPAQARPVLMGKRLSCLLSSCGCCFTVQVPLNRPQEKAALSTAAVETSFLPGTLC